MLEYLELSEAERWRQRLADHEPGLPSEADLFQIFPGAVTRLWWVQTGQDFALLPEGLQRVELHGRYDFFNDPDGVFTNPRRCQLYFGDSVDLNVDLDAEPGIDQPRRYSASELEQVPETERDALDPANQPGRFSRDKVFDRVQLLEYLLCRDRGAIVIPYGEGGELDYAHLVCSESTFASVKLCALTNQIMQSLNATAKMTDSELSGGTSSDRALSDVTSPDESLFGRELSAAQEAKISAVLKRFNATVNFERQDPIPIESEYLFDLLRSHFGYPIPQGNFLEY